MEPPYVAPGADDALFASLYPSLRRFAAFVGPTSADPDDLVQEATARALRHGPLTRLESPDAYLRTTIVRLAANERRRIWRRDRAHERLSAQWSDGQADAQYPSDTAVIDSLRPIDRAVLFATVIEGRSRASAAQLLGMSEAALRQRLSRSLRALRHKIEQEEARCG
jgi:RNA polymerase sigma factor (sigma-70 family)